jgi:hypothetical protein
LTHKACGACNGTKGHFVEYCGEYGEERVLKEMRELVGFILGFVSDVVELLSTSRLSMSPITTLGRDRAGALQVTGTIGIVLVTIFIRTWSTQPPKIDLLPFSVLTIGYFAFISFAVSLAIKWQQASAADKAKSDPQTDAYSYVIAFNLIALLVFALLREVLHFYFNAEQSLPAAFGATLVAGAATLLVGNQKRDANSDLTVRQRVVIAALLCLSFFGYAAGAAGI